MVRELERDEVDAFIVGKQIDKVRASLPAALSDHHSKDVKYPVFGRVTYTLYCNVFTTIYCIIKWRRHIRKTEKHG